MMNTKIKPQAVANARDQQIDDIRGLYMESLHLVERLHRRLLDVIKDEFDRQGRDDVNAVQALLLFNIGNSELTAGELRWHCSPYRPVPKNRNPSKSWAAATPAATWPGNLS